MSATSRDSMLVGLKDSNKKTFMTEASIAKSVTIKTPHKDGRLWCRNYQGGHETYASIACANRDHYYFFEGRQLL